MLEITPLRQEIDLVDEQLLVLLNRRAQLVQQVAHWKQAQQIPVFDPTREQQIVSHLRTVNAGPLTDQQVEGIFRFFFQQFRQLEQRLINQQQQVPAKKFEQIGILGAGLMGGSFALAIFKFLPSCRVQIFDTQETCIPGAVNRVEDLFGCDLLILAIPVGGILDFLTKYGPQLPAGLMVLDLGSTKAEIIQAAEMHLPTGVIFIGGHPLAGKERSGAAEADADLFWERTFFLSATQKSLPESMAAIHWLLTQIGARVVEVEGEQHDRILACTSHLPQMLAVLLALVAREHFSTQPVSPGPRPYVGRNFLESTRVAVSDYRMWRDIALTNAGEIRFTLERLIHYAQLLLPKISTADFADFFAQAKEFVSGLQGEGRP